MSECVVRIEKPTSCDDCDIAIKYQRFGIEIYCPFFGWYADYDKCPVFLQLPEGHGRLVDADKLADDMKARKAFFGRRSDPQCIVEDAPTIVPAERSET